MRLVAASFFVAICCSQPAFADRASDAREHYQNATAHFAVGEFAEAAAEYQEAFKLKPDPALLFNAAQSYRLASKPEKAVILYKNYLQIYPDQPNADEVRGQIAKLQDVIAAAAREQRSASGAAATPEPKAPPSPPLASAPGVRPAEPAPVASASAPAVAKKRETPVYRKWWLWTIVGVVAAGGAATTAVLLTRKSNWANAPDVGPGSTNALVRW